MGYKNQYNYLKQRSRLSLLYRRHLLYPRLCRHLCGRVLDFGCGIGDFLKFRPNTIGVDVNPFVIEWCRSLGLQAIRIQNLPLPFSANEFEGAIMDNVIEHLIDPAPILDEISRVVIEGGTLIVGIPGLRGYLHDSDHKRFYDEQTLVDQLNETGFKCVKIYHMPLKSSCLNRTMRQYCVYGVFQNTKMS